MVLSCWTGLAQASNVDGGGVGASASAVAADGRGAGATDGPPVDRFLPVRTEAGCAIAMRPPTDPEGAAMRAVCRWPEVDADRLAAVLGQFERYPEFVFPIAAATVERQDGDRALVYQRQSLLGIADREVLLWMRQTRDADGAVRVSWEAATDEPLALSPGAVRTPRNTGYWEVAADPVDGTRVVHEIAMDAGGYVPQWLVNLVRTRAFARIMGDVRAFAAQL